VSDTGGGSGTGMTDLDNGRHLLLLFSFKEN